MSCCEYSYYVTLLIATSFIRGATGGPEFSQGAVPPPGHP